MLPIILGVEATLRAALEAIGDGVLIFNADGRVIVANEPWRNMWNVPSAWSVDDISDRLDELSPPVVGEKSYDLLEMNGGRLVERFLTPLLHHGDTDGHVLVFRDVTDRIQTDSELREAHRALDRITTGYRGVWAAVATVLRRLMVVQETVRAYNGDSEAHGWEFQDAVQLIARQAGVERSRRDRVDLATRAAEVAGYAARIGRSAGVTVNTTMAEEVWIVTDADLFVSGVFAALLGFVLAIAPNRETLDVRIARNGEGPLTVSLSPGVTRSDLDQMREQDSSRPGALHAALLRAFAITLGLEISVDDESDDAATVVEVRGL